MADVAFLTDRAHAELTAGDRLLAAALDARGHPVAPWMWEEPAPRPFDAVVLRSAWDVWEEPGRSRAFVRRLEEIEATGAVLVNSLATVRWALDKRYVLDLADAGVPVPATVVVDDPHAAGAIAAARGWDHAVLKPRLGGSGWGVRRVEAGAEAPVDLPATDGGWLVQELLPGIVDGEIDLVVVRGEVLHAVRKTPPPGEFRSNWAFGARWEVCDPPAPAIEVARRALAEVPGAPVYVRVDGVLQDGRFTVLEVEAVDPSLFLALGPAASVDRVADAFAAVIQRAGFESRSRID